MAAQKVRLLTILAFLTIRSCDSFRADVYKVASQFQDPQVEKSIKIEQYCPPGFCLEKKVGEDLQKSLDSMAIARTSMHHKDGKLVPLYPYGPVEDDLTGLVKCKNPGGKLPDDPYLFFGNPMTWSPDGVDTIDGAHDRTKERIDKRGWTVAKLCMPSSPAVPGGSVEEEVLDEDDFAGDVLPTSPTATGDMDTGSIDVNPDVDTSGEVQTPDSQDSPSSGAKGKKITIAGFPEDIDGVHRGVLNGVYYQALGDHCVQGKPTYWRKLEYGSEEYDSLKQPDQDLPFLYFCKQNSSTQLWHRKWAISRAADFNKIKAGKCETFAPFPARKELEVGVGPTAVHLGWKDGQNLGFGEPADHAWMNDIKITAVEDMDESPTIDCSAGEAPGLDATGPPKN